MRTSRVVITILLGAAAALLPASLVAGAGGAGGEFVPPKVIPSSMVQPVYPEQEKTAGTQGTVMLGVEIRSDGTIAGIKAEQQVEGHPAFTASAIAAVGKWRFEPAQQDGQPIACSIKIPVRFVLDEKKK